jgi:hypothetical protein
VNYEEEMRKKMRWMRGDVCVWWGRRKKKGRGGKWVVGEKKKGKKKRRRKRIKKWEVGYTCMVGKKRRVEKERRKKIEREKTKLVLFVCSFYFVQNVEL